MKRIIIVFTALVFAGSSCKKDNTNGHCGSVINHIEFTLDGQRISIEDCLDVSSGQFSDNLSLPLYQCLGYFSTYPSDGRAVSIDQISNMPLSEQTYVYSSFADFEHGTYPSFIYVESSHNTYVFNTSSSTGSISYIQVEKEIGGMVKGTFNFQNIDYNDENSNLISSGHTITDGVFEIKVDVIN